MDLSLSIPENPNGRHGRLPVQITFSSDTYAELAGEPVINVLRLISEEQEIMFGRSKAITVFPGEPIGVDKHDPFELVVDVLEYDEESEVPSGTYDLKVKSSYYLRDPNGDISLHVGEVIAQMVVGHRTLEILAVPAVSRVGY